MYSLRIHRGSGVKGSTSAAFPVQVDARIATVLDLKRTIVEQHPELAGGGPLQLQILGQGGRGGRSTLPDAARLTALRMEQQCTAPATGTKPAAELLLNQGNLAPEEEMTTSSSHDARLVAAAVVGRAGHAPGGALLTGSLLDRLTALTPPFAGDGSTNDDLDGLELDFSEAEFVPARRPGTNSPVPSGV
jgi:hypothetical protein